MAYFSADTGLKASVVYVYTPFSLPGVAGLSGIGLIDEMYTGPSF